VKKERQILAAVYNHESGCGNDIWEVGNDRGIKTNNIYNLEKTKNTS